MSRFIKNISGEFGKYWIKEAEKEVAKRVEEIETGKMIIENGVATWKTKGNVVPSEIIEQVIYAGYDIDVDKCNELREEQEQKFLKAYRERMKNYKPSYEELAEMENAFGKGATVVDVITGKAIQL